MRTCMFSMVLCFAALPLMGQVSTQAKAEPVQPAEPSAAGGETPPQASDLKHLLRCFDAALALGPAGEELSRTAAKLHPEKRARPIFTSLADRQSKRPKSSENPSIEVLKKTFGALDLHLTQYLAEGLLHEAELAVALNEAKGVHQEFLQAVAENLVTPLDRLLSSYDALMDFAPLSLAAHGLELPKSKVARAQPVLDWVAQELAKSPMPKDGQESNPASGDQTKDPKVMAKAGHVAAESFASLLDSYMKEGELQRPQITSAIKLSKGARLALLQQLRRHIGVAIEDMLASLDNVLKFGRHAHSAAIQQRRKHPLIPARATIRVVAKHLSRLPRESPAPEKKLVAAAVASFADHLGEFIKDGSLRIAETENAAASATGFKQKFLKSLASRLGVNVAFDEIATYVDKGGQFEGMFPKTAALGRHGGLAMVDLFSDFDLDAKVRSLAGEGAAQLGSKEDIEAVRVVYDDDLEDAPLREKAKIILARLGDRSLVEADLKAWKKLVKENADTYTESYKLYQKLMPEFEELSKVATKSAEQDARHKELTKQRSQLVGKINNAVAGLGQLHNSIGFRYLDLREWELASASLEKCVNCYRQLASGGRPNQNLAGTVRSAYYNLACALARQDKTKAALKALENSFRWGYANFEWVLTDRDLASLEGEDKSLTKLVEEVRSGAAVKRWKKEVEQQRKAALEKAKADSGEGESGSEN